MSHFQYKKSLKLKFALINYNFYLSAEKFVIL